MYREVEIYLVANFHREPVMKAKKNLVNIFEKNTIS